MLETALDVARRGGEDYPPRPAPAGLRPFLGFARLPPRALDVARRALDDDDFRERVRAQTSEDDVGRAGWLLLTRPPGWEGELAALVQAAEEEAAAGEGDRRARAAERRLATAEQARLRAEATAETAQRRETDARGELQEERRRRRVAESELGRVRRRLEDLESELAARTAELVDARARAAEAEAAVRGIADAEPAEPGGAGERGRRSTIRRPVGLPPAVSDDSVQAAAHLVRVPGLVLLVDGYNVAMVGWPELAIDEQRERLVDALEALAERTETDVHVVFDGVADRELQVRTRPRSRVRVTFTPSEVTADDVILDLVDRLRAATPVAVASNDREVQTGAARGGANVIRSRQLLDLLASR